MKKHTISQADYLRLRKNPERRFSMLAWQLTGNLLSGLLIEVIAERAGRPLSYKEMSDATYSTYSQCRLAIESLESAGLIVIWKQRNEYTYNKSAGRPEKNPLQYLLTEDGQKCVIGTLTDMQNNVQVTVEEETRDEQVEKGKAIAEQCGLLIGDRLNLSNYKLKTEDLTDVEKALLKAYIDRKKSER